MSRPRRLLLRATTLITIAALTLSLVGWTWAAPPARPPSLLTTSLAAYWKLDETSGSRADSAGANTLSDNNTAPYGAGVVGNAADFNGSDEYLRITDNADVSLGNSDYSLATWFWLDSLPPATKNDNIIGKRSSSFREWELFVTSGGLLNWSTRKTGNGADNFSYAVTPTISTGQWYFVAIVYNAATDVLTMSLNNTYSTVATGYDGVWDSNNDLLLGYRPDAGIGNQWLDGRVDETGLWKRVLTPAEISDLYNAGAGCTYPFTGCDSAIPTATPVAPTGNLIRNWDFSNPPRVPEAAWATMNRVVQSPYSDLEMNIDDIPNGSCGETYWVMSRTGGTDGRIYQDFGWSGGQMYINFEAVTNNFITRGEVSVLNKQTGDEEFLSTFTNGSMTWQTFKFQTSSQPAGQYRLGFSYDGFGPAAGLGVDNVNVRGGYWGNDCPAGIYSGQIPGTTNATAVAVASPTPPAISPNTPINTNCGFEQGMSGYNPNAGARLFYTGGATGPTYAYLFTVYDNGSDPSAVDIPGSLGMPFYWPGGQMMYVSYFTGPGTRATVTLRNAFTGYARELQSSATSQSYGGWVKRSMGFFVPVAGNYELLINVPWGQIGAFDGIAVSTGGFASGSCSTSNSAPDNNATATQHVANTAAAATATNQPAVILTSYAVATNQAAAYSTYLAGQYATMTQNAARTQAAQQTATAQGTPAPTATRTPAVQPSPGGPCLMDPLTLVWVCPNPVTVAAPGNDDLTAIAAEMTAQAAAQETFWAAAQATSNARATGTAAYQQTQVAAPIQATQRAAQTATARANQTAIAAAQTATAVVDGLNAQQTQQALQTQQAQQAAATQTAAAQQATAAAGNSTQQADATNTAVAYATQYGAVTATANAQRTANAVATAAAQSTAVAQATSNAIATSVSLATQQAGQAQATQTAVALQTSLPATANATAIAQATTTAQAYATAGAQTTATAQAAATSVAATQQASGTTTPGDGGDLPPVDDRPEPGPSQDCIRPTSPLQVANWIDYEVCRILTWFAWSPANTEQLTQLEAMAATAGPFGLLAEIGDTFGVFGSWITSLNWCDGGFCQDQPLAPLNLEASGILTGNWDFSDGTPYYSDQCTVLMGPLLGPYIQSGACFCVNVLCALGVLPWFQLMFNALLVFMALIYVKQTWMTAAHT